MGSTNKGGGERRRKSRVRNLKGERSVQQLQGERGRDSLHICVQFCGASKVMDSTYITETNINTRTS